MDWGCSTVIVCTTKKKGKKERHSLCVSLQMPFCLELLESLLVDCWQRLGVEKGIIFACG
jgi:hypothetical protein